MFSCFHSPEKFYPSVQKHARARVRAHVRTHAGHSPFSIQICDHLLPPRRPPHVSFSQSLSHIIKRSKRMRPMSFFSPFNATLCFFFFTMQKKKKKKVVEVKTDVEVCCRRTQQFLGWSTFWSPDTDTHLQLGPLAKCSPPGKRERLQQTQRRFCLKSLMPPKTNIVQVWSKNNKTKQRNSRKCNRRDRRGPETWRSCPGPKRLMYSYWGWFLHLQHLFC